MNRPILRRPVENNFPVSQEFWVSHPGDKFFEWAYRLFDGHHPGVDFDMPEGNSIFSAYGGVVVRREWHDGMGNVVGIRNGNVVALYAHMSDFRVNLGQKVTSGTIVGISGNTGSATMPNYPHLHFELRDINKPSLKEMVFEPNFDKSICCWKDTFSYVVNNDNTNKTLQFLALCYFGDPNKWKDIIGVNPDLKKFSESDILPNGIVVKIPNL